MIVGAQMLPRPGWLAPAALAFTAPALLAPGPVGVLDVGQVVPDTRLRRMDLEPLPNPSDAAASKLAFFSPGHAV